MVKWMHRPLCDWAGCGSAQILKARNQSIYWLWSYMLISANFSSPFCWYTYLMWQAVYSNVSDRPCALKWDHNNKPLLSSFWRHSHAADEPEPLSAPWDLKGSLCALFSSSPLPFVTLFLFQFSNKFPFGFHFSPQTWRSSDVLHRPLNLFNFLPREKHLNLSLHLFITATFTRFSTHFSSPLLSICDCVFSTTFVSARLLLLTFSTDTLLGVFLFYSEGNFHKRVIIEVLDHSWACTAGVVESLL